tara:strand:- start:1112 stop:1504 length:393 start_codon:yes stop_codon:yes gene_type:complete
MIGLNNIFTGLINNAEGILDKTITTDKDRLKAKNELKKLFANAEASAQEQVTRRWEADAKSDNYLSKNIRPLTLIFLTGVFVIISFFDGNIGEFQVNSAYVNVYQTLLITTYAAYFSGRSIEKLKKIKNT